MPHTYHTDIQFNSPELRGMVANWTDWHAYWLDRHGYHGGYSGGLHGGLYGGLHEHDESLLMIPYETLLADPVGVLARVCEFVGYRHVRYVTARALVRVRVKQGRADSDARTHT